MRKFATKIFETVKGKQVFEKLLVDDICLIDEFENEIRQKKQYISELTTIFSYMDLLANGSSLPNTKFREIKGIKSAVKRYEFKSKHLRVYAFNIPGGKMVVMGGYKNTQEADIRSFHSIVDEYLSLNNK
ncbi:MAG: hypothetical protein KBG25_02705 [Paludibacteraceae bacterium]|nr:hypothetical protein [Paludibacteraceae bacterium]